MVYGYRDYTTLSAAGVNFLYLFERFRNVELAKGRRVSTLTVYVG